MKSLSLWFLACVAIALLLAGCKPATETAPVAAEAATSSAMTAAHPVTAAETADAGPTNANSAAAAPAIDTAASPAAADASSTATAPPAADGSFRIVSVLLGPTLDAEHVVVGDSTLFSPRDAIHASVLSVGASQGLRISARWLGPDGSTIAETSQPLVPTAATATTFTISSSKPWPGGDYQMIVAVNGDALQTRKFKVR